MPIGFMAHDQPSPPECRCMTTSPSVLARIVRRHWRSSLPLAGLMAVLVVGSTCATSVSKDPPKDPPAAEKKQAGPVKPQDLQTLRKIFGENAVNIYAIDGKPLVEFVVIVDVVELFGTPYLSIKQAGANAGSPGVIRCDAIGAICNFDATHRK
jgi:hypothetical protein